MRLPWRREPDAPEQEGLQRADELLREAERREHDTKAALQRRARIARENHIASAFSHALPIERHAR